MKSSFNANAAPTSVSIRSGGRAVRKDKSPASNSLTYSFIFSAYAAKSGSAELVGIGQFYASRGCGLSLRAELIMVASSETKNGLRSTGLSLNNSGIPARPYPLRKTNGRPRASTISAIGPIPKPPTLMSKSPKSNVELPRLRPSECHLLRQLRDAQAPQAFRRSSFGLGPRPQPKIWTRPASQL